MNEAFVPTNLISVFDFRRMDMESLKESFSLKMPLSSLKAVQRHYISSEKRDVFADELLMLDAMISSSYEKAKNERKYFLREFICEDSEVSEVFKNLCKKLDSMGVSTNESIPFDAAVSLAGKYLKNVLPSDISPLADIKFSEEDDIILSCIADGCTFSEKYSAEGFEFAVCNEKLKEKAPRRGIYFQIQKNDSLKELISSLRQKNGLVFTADTVKTNIIEHIISDADGGEIYTQGNFSTLASNTPGDLVICCDINSSNEVASTIADAGMRYRIAGKKSKGKLFTFKYSNGESFAADTRFLKNLNRFSNGEAVSAYIPKADASNKTDCCRLNIKSEEIYTDKRFPVFLPELVPLCFESGITSSPYENGMELVTLAAAAYVAENGDRESICFDTSIFYPVDASHSALFAFILGFFRASLELCAVSSFTKLLVSESCRAPSAKAVALAHGKAKDNCESLKAYLVYPRSDYGKLSYENVRKSFSYICELKRKVPCTFAKAVTDGDCADLCGKFSKEDSCGFAFLVRTSASLSEANGIAVAKINEKSM